VIPDPGQCGVSMFVTTDLDTLLVALYVEIEDHLDHRRIRQAIAGRSWQLISPESLI